MSEYIELEPEETDDPHVLMIESNVTLTVEGVEVYESAELMFEGSPLAQALAIIPGIVHLRIEPDALIVTRAPEFEWYTITEDVKAVIVDFFL